MVIKHKQYVMNHTELYNLSIIREGNKSCHRSDKYPRKNDKYLNKFGIQCDIRNDDTNK